MKTMKVMRFNDSADAPELIADNVPVPEPGQGQILVRVRAAGVTPTESLWYPTTHTIAGGTRAGAIPGHEFSGEIVGIGPGVEANRVGQEVFGMNDWFADGATAEYCLTTPACVAAKPVRLSHAEMATVPIGALTAWQGLFERLRLQEGERLLIHGAAGAVGVFAVQLARQIGVEVIATASAQNFDFLQQLGPHQLIDYHSDRFEERAGKVDAVFDAVGGETLRRSWDVLGPGGRLVTIAADSEGARDERTKQAFFIVEPKEGQLAEIAHLLDASELRTFVAAEVPLADASAAYTGAVSRPHGYGKAVLAL